MKKKTIMLGLFAANLILFLLYSMLSFCVYPEACVQKDKITLTVKWKEQMEHTAYIDRLYAIADEIGGDLMLSVMTGDYVNQYYRTEKDPSFIPIEGLQPGVRYSTDPKAGEEKIKGFFFLPDSDFRIAPLRTLEDMDIDLSVQAILIRSDREKAFSESAEKYGLELVRNGHGRTGEASVEGFYLAMAALAFFLFVSVVFYAFSRAKDMFVKKTLGYSNRNIVAAEMRENARALLQITGILLLIAFVLFSVLSDLSSTLYFFKVNWLMILLYLLGTVLLVFLLVYLVCKQCSIRSSKGKSFDKQLFAVTLLFKAAIIWAIAVSISGLLTNFRLFYSTYRSARNSASLAEGYAATTINVRLEDPGRDPERYTDTYRSFYRKMHDDYNLIVAQFPEDSLYTPWKGASDTIYGKINDNYLDSFDTIYGTDGKPIRSDRLVAGKKNYLISEHYDPNGMEKQDSEDEHYIVFSDTSSFFTFSSQNHNGVICGERMLVEVYDPEFEFQHGDNFLSSAQLGSLYTGSTYFRYDTESPRTPYEQVFPVVKETGMDKIFLAAPTVQQEFMQWVDTYRESVLIVIAALLCLMFALAVIIVNAAELDYRIHARDLAVKCVTGYALWDVLLFRILGKMLMIPVLLMFVSVPIAIGCVLIELLIYIPCMKRRYKTNAVTVLKGE